MTNFAVLISTFNVTNEIDTHSSAWYDLVMLYSALISNGFSAANIFVLYGTGIDFNTTHFRYSSTTNFHRNITQWPADESSIKKIFQMLSTGAQNTILSDGSTIDIPQLTMNDLLFVWWNGHGFKASGMNTAAVIKFQDVNGNWIFENNLVNYFSVADKYSSRLLIFQTCCSGGIIPNFTTTRDTIVMTSADYYQEAFSDDYVEIIAMTFWTRVWYTFQNFFRQVLWLSRVEIKFIDVIWHSPFNYHLYSAIMRHKTDGGSLTDNPDENNDNKISVQECFNYIVDNINAQNIERASKNERKLSIPFLGDPANLASNLYLF